jgi:hypothetical protein
MVKDVKNSNGVVCVCGKKGKPEYTVCSPKKERTKKKKIPRFLKRRVIPSCLRTGYLLNRLEEFLQVHVGFAIVV